MSQEHNPARQRKAAGTPAYEPSYTPDEFCAAERISRSKLYEYWKTGRGPRYYLNGVSRRITHAAQLNGSNSEWTRRTRKSACRPSAVRSREWSPEKLRAPARVTHPGLDAKGPDER